MKNLVIVESPTKARTIGKFLGSDYIIKASMGHVVDLPKSTLSIDIADNFKPLYEMVADKKSIISELKSAAKSAESIILATDPDREGEAIAHHVANILMLDNRSLKLDKEAGSLKIESKRDKDRTSSFQRPVSRIVFHEITKEAINDALQHPRQIDRNLVNAQTARRVLDRLVGYKLSPLLWKKVRRGLSAGRVQSVALRLIVEREREIEKFSKSKYFTIHVLLSQKTQKTQKSGASDNQKVRRSDVPSFPSVPTENATEFELIEINGEKIEIQKTFDLYDGQYKIAKTSIDSEKKALGIVADLKTKNFTVSDVLQKATRRSPAPPYTTSTLQQDASRRLGFSGKRTMSLAQKLYEEGLITYHRTDSLNLSPQAVFAMRDFIKKEYGGKYIPPAPRFYKTKQKLAQEAHESIRPTAVGQLLMIKDKLLSIGGQQGWKLYELIWKRAVASQMSDAIIESTTVFVDTSVNVILNPSILSRAGSVKDPRLQMPGASATGGQVDSSASPQNDKREYRLKASGSVLVFDGFLKANPLGLSDNRLPQFIASEKLGLVDVLEKEHETLPPPRYNDASIIKTLEEKGIGRPSTYATIVSTIESRNYIERIEGRFQPTPVGTAVNDFLVTNFSDIDDIPFTATMEDELDNIAHGKSQWVPMMKNFYTPFEKKLKEVEGAERVKIAVEETSELCPECKKVNLVIRTGRFGKFLSCSTFPACKFTKAFVEQTGLSCPKDGAQIVIKKTKKGRRFYGCSNYPKCTFAAWKLEDIKRVVK